MLLKDLKEFFLCKITIIWVYHVKGFDIFSILVSFDIFSILVSDEYWLH